MLPLCFLPLIKSNQSSTLSNHPKIFQILIILLLLSLGGLPPLTGFAPKLVALQTLAQSNQPILSIFLVLGSLLNLRYYLNLFFNLSMKTTLTKMKQPSLNYPYKLLIALSLLSTTGLPLMYSLARLPI